MDVGGGCVQHVLRFAEGFSGLAPSTMLRCAHRGIYDLRTKSHMTENAYKELKTPSKSSTSTSRSGFQHVVITLVAAHSASMNAASDRQSADDLKLCQRLL